MGRPAREQRFGPGIWRDIAGDHLVSHIVIPVLVVHAPDDPQVPFVGSQRLVRAWKGSELVETPGLGHGAITRDPSVMERAVGFVSQRALTPVTSRPA